MFLILRKQLCINVSEYVNCAKITCYSWLWQPINRTNRQGKMDIVAKHIVHHLRYILLAVSVIVYV